MHRMALALAVLTGCGARGVNLNPDPLVLPPMSAPCTATASVVAHVPGVQLRPMVMDNPYLYVVARAASGDPDRRDLWRVSKTGDPPVVLAADQLPIVHMVASYASDGYAADLYWTTQSSADRRGAVWKLARGASAPMLLAGGRLAPGPIDVDSTTVYWAELSDNGAGVASPQIVSESLGGGTPQLVHELEPSRMPAALVVSALGDAETLFWTTADPDAGNQSQAEIDMLSLSTLFGVKTLAGPDAGGAGAFAIVSEVVIYGGPTSLQALALDARGDALRMDGGVPSAGFVSSIAVSGYGAYPLFFVNPGNGALTAGTSSVLGRKARPPLAIADAVDPRTSLQADASCVYFIDATAEAVEAVYQPIDPGPGLP